jgi:pimeloyl-ACP methyl ester carboxylesterase
MGALGHQRFAMVGVDSGMPIGYALAADHPDRLDRLAVGEAVIAGVTPSPPLFGPAQLNNAFWHIPFNRLTELNGQLVRGHKDLYFGFQFAKGGHPPPDYAEKVLHRHPRLRPPRTARELRAVPRVGHQ